MLEAILGETVVVYSLRFAATVASAVCTRSFVSWLACPVRSNLLRVEPLTPANWLSCSSVQPASMRRFRSD